MALADQLASVVLRLADVAREPGSEAAAASGIKRESLLRRASRLNLQNGIGLPLGFNLVRYTRIAEGARMEALWLGGNLGPFLGDGLETTAERIEEKQADLDRWPASYDERWLVVPSLNHSRTSVEHVRCSNRRFPGTGFDRIYILDFLHPIQMPEEERGVNVTRLDIHEE